MCKSLRGPKAPTLLARFLKSMRATDGTLRTLGTEVVVHSQIAGFKLEQPFSAESVAPKLLAAVSMLSCHCEALMREHPPLTNGIGHV